MIFYIGEWFILERVIKTLKASIESDSSIEAVDNIITSFHNTQFSKARYLYFNFFIDETRVDSIIEDSATSEITDCSLITFIKNNKIEYASIAEIMASNGTLELEPDSNRKVRKGRMKKIVPREKINYSILSNIELFAE
jgi:hypothetical protein